MLAAFILSILFLSILIFLVILLFKNIKSSQNSNDHRIDIIYGTLTGVKKKLGELEQTINSSMNTIHKLHEKNTELYNSTTKSQKTKASSAGFSKKTSKDKKNTPPKKSTS